MWDTYGGLVLAGGQGKRMGGTDKSSLYCGDETFLQRLHKVLEPFPYRYLSGNMPAADTTSTFISVPDVEFGKGPLCGLYSVLRVCKPSALFVLPCDMPFFSRILVEYILSKHKGEAVFTIRDCTGREYPLCGVYTKDCLPVLRQALEENRLRVRAIREEAGGSILDLPEAFAPETELLNVNTPEVYKKVQGGTLCV